MMPKLCIMVKPTKIARLISKSGAIELPSFGAGAVETTSVMRPSGNAAVGYS